MLSGRSTLLSHLLLVCGAGGLAEPTLADMLRAESGPGLRSCLDGGSDMVVSLVFNGVARQLRFYLRQPDDEVAGRSRWSVWRIAPPGRPVHGWRRLYAGESPGTWAEVREACGKTVDELTSAGPGPRPFERWHAVLGPHGRIYSLSASAGEAPWIAWQLDQRVDIRRALDACGLESGEGRELIASILDAAPGTLRGPWSLAMRADGERWRLGSSEWARRPEFQDKRRRFARAVALVGADDRFAEAVYKLVEAEQGEGPPARIGRAIEVEFGTAVQPGRPLAIECFLAVPENPGRRYS